MANIYKNEKTSLTTTALTTLYTVPSNSRAIVKSLLVAEDGIRDRSPSRGLGDVYKRQATNLSPFTITSSTTKVDTRARGRYANIKIENTGAGESWRFGTFQVDLQPDGRRG